MWLESLFSIHSAVQAVVVLSAVCALGLALGKLHYKGISLGIAFVFFIGIVGGHYGFTLNHDVLLFAESFGLSMFVYALGLYVGPNFFGSLRHEGIQLNLWGLGVVLTGTLMAILLCYVLPVNVADMVGILCGATTNTPALGAAQQALEQMGLQSGRAALGCAVTYPLGVVGVILAMVIMRKLFVKPIDLQPHSSADEDHTYVGQFVAVNPALAGKSLAAISLMTHRHFIISRIWRNGQVIVPHATTTLQVGDNLLVVTNKEEVSAMEILFGQKVEKDWNREQIDWNAIDSKVESRVIVMTKTQLNGKRLDQLQLRSTYGVNVSRVTRGDIKLLATDHLRLQYGDRLTIVGPPADIDHVEAFLGNAVQTLNEPNLGAIFLGMLLGVAVGAIPIDIPGMTAPVRLGIAGGPIIMGIVIGALGPRVHFISYMTRSAGLMLRKLGLSLYLACLGIDAGGQFFETVVRPEGLMWVGIGFLLTVVPVLTVGCIALRLHKFDFGTICGILCGSMANPMALTYADDTIDGDAPSVSYATVYPLGMFIRVIIAQVMVMFLV
ncbi:putative transporter [Prevotella sp. A2931]|uniref:Transporter n=1 Tax=Prevotella illustrans TaxID=2800387 RepID=A0ABS3M7T2_9BACT|nr:MULTISPECIES: putative transporter [Prevotella]MBO1364234.1 putative transporter [Prevotella illustrans]PTL26906.1 putative transporter [Prevotella sp. oral taxon 820]